MYEDEMQGMLDAFTKEENTFALKNYFRSPFCAAVHQELILGFLSNVFQICADYCDGAAEKSSNFPPALLLILARFTQVSDCHGEGGSKFALSNVED